MPMQMPILMPMLMSIYRCQDLQMAFFNPVTTPEKMLDQKTLSKNWYQKKQNKSKSNISWFSSYAALIWIEIFWPFWHHGFRSKAIQPR